MKRCPACGTTYTDDTLKYCLADGQRLGDAPDETTTVVRTRSDPADADTIAIRPDATRASGAADPGTRGILIKLAIALAVAVLLAVIVIAGGAAIYILSAGNGNVATANNAVRSPVPPTPAPTRDNRDELRDQIANLERRLEEQLRTGSNSAKPYSTPEMRSSGVTARVDSPRDGFLALRSLPSSEIGDRVTTIPHGARVSLGACGPVTAVKRRGRWCQASYAGYTGWVFDGYLIYDSK